MNRSSMRLGVLALLLLAALLGSSTPTQAQNVIATIPGLSGPNSVGVNPTTNRIYVTNGSSNAVSVIDGATNAIVATIPVGLSPVGVAVNPMTNRLYVANESSNTTSVIDGGTNAVVATVPVGISPIDVAVNPASNRIYVANGQTFSLSVIDGTTNAVVATVPIAGGKLAVNPTTNRIYEADAKHSLVVVVDATTNAVVTTIPAGGGTSAITVNPTTNRVYVADLLSRTVAVIDGTTNTVVATVSGFAAPAGVAVNPTTNRIYVANNANGTIAVIDGTTNAIVATIPVGTAPLNVGVNPTTNRIYVANTGSNSVTVIQDRVPSPSCAPNAPFFPETGFCIDNPAILAYFQGRGGVDTFGFPVSRTFRLLGFTVQVFQRHVLQIGNDGTVRPLNLLDPGLMPVSSVNFATFPPHDAAVATAAPPPTTPDYGHAVLHYLQTTVPDSFDGQNVQFLEFYLSAARGSGFPALVALEVWGFPTSRPARDPNNHEFIYQRFQRGILHSFPDPNNPGHRVTRGILLADNFKFVLTNDPTLLPADLRAQMQGSPFFNQYCPGRPNWLCRPDQLVLLGPTDLTNAFVPQLPGTSALVG